MENRAGASKFRPRPLPGDIAGFRVVDEIFDGGMSTVYRGKDPSDNLDVAIKWVTKKHTEAYDRRDRENRKEWDGYRYLKGVTWEGEILSNLNHPHIVHLYEYGKLDGRYFLVMQYLPSRNLHELICADSPLLEPRRLKISYHFAHAILHMHRMGIIHRDICPRNVLLDENHRAVLIDFGLAIPRLDKLKDVFHRAGTPSYMAPEVIRSDHYDYQTDIYAFGVSLYELFTGKTPYGGSDDFDRVAQHLNAPVIAPRALNPALPTALEAIILRALEKSRDRRYATMDQLVRDLERLVQKDSPSETTRLLIRGDSRRLYDRVRDHCYLHYYVKGWLRRGPREVAVTENIGAGGLACRVRNPPPVGTPLHLEVQPRAATHRIHAVGRVAHVGPPDDRALRVVGVAFTRISRRDRARFAKYVQAQLAVEGPTPTS